MQWGVEGLEGRRLLAANLFPSGLRFESTKTAERGQAIHAYVEYSQSGGTLLESGQVSMELRLVPHPFTQKDLSTLSFDDPNAIVLGTGKNGGFVPDADGPYSTQTGGTIPSDAPFGTYAMMFKLDSTNVIAESNEADNVGIVFGLFQVLTQDGRMQISGTGGADSLFIQRVKVGNENRVYFDPANTGPYFNLGAATAWDVKLLGGDDVVEVYGLMNGLVVDLGDGNDRFKGGGGDETVSGGAQRDRLFGGFGNDRLNGNGGNDLLIGDSGSDRLYGYAGNDYLDGGSSGDRLEGGEGADTLVGQGGNDRFFTTDSSVDELFGGSDTDAATADASDVLASIERSA
jgi:Ca2+-binding RTX toxin-like protein